MYKKLLFALFFLVSGRVLQAQSYAVCIYKGDSLHLAKNYVAALEWYDKAFRIQSSVPSDLYHAAGTAVQAGDFRKVFQLLDQAYDNGWNNVRWLKRDPDFTAVHGMKAYEAFIRKAEQKADNPELGYDGPLRAELLEILKTDQKLREKERICGDTYGWLSDQMDTLQLENKKTDSLNVLKVRAILDRNGWVGPEKVGKDGTETLYIVLLHAGQKTLEQYLPVMREAAASGKLSKPKLCIVEDRVALGQGKRQIYGTQIYRHPNTGQYYVAPLEDPDHVDERRQSMGLVNLSDYLNSLNIAWDAEAYKQALPGLEKLTPVKN